MSALLCLAAVAGVRADDFAALRAEAEAGRAVLVVSHREAVLRSTDRIVRLEEVLA